MALIPCPECSNQVSTLAASCPQCGAPIAPREPIVALPAANPDQPVTIQRTSKSIKSTMAFCAILFWLGLLGYFFDRNPNDTAWGWIIVASAVGWFLTKIARWWENG